MQVAFGSIADVARGYIAALDGDTSAQRVAATASLSVDYAGGDPLRDHRSGLVTTAV